LLDLRDSRITRQGILILKAQQFRTQDANKKDAIKRLHDLVNKAAIVPAYRRATRPTRGSVRRRLESKTQRSQIKTLRGRVNKDSM
jgi:ribosome-associated protein